MGEVRIIFCVSAYGLRCPRLSDTLNGDSTMNGGKCAMAIPTEKKKFELTITADSVTSTDRRFTMDNLALGDYYEMLDTCFQNADGEIIRRKYGKGERSISNLVMPRLAFQIFEEQIAGLSAEEREQFPICRYTRDKDVIRGIYSNVEEFEKRVVKGFERLTYTCDSGRQFFIYTWNLFSTVFFVWECLKRFGKPGDKFVLIYQEKGEGPVINYSSMLKESKNLIFRGAPGTGKSYLAKKIAADIISGGTVDDYTRLSDEQKKQMEFVQFHPSYDYSDFVEGLRPKVNDDGSMGFELRDGIFKSFVDRARKNYENAQKPKEMIAKELSVQEAMADFFSNIELGKTTFQTINGNVFTITGVNDTHVNVFIPGNDLVKKLTLDLDEIKRMLEAEKTFTMIKEITSFFGKTFATQGYSYDFAIYKEIKAKMNPSVVPVAQPEKRKEYVFIIDEINRGEISKIFGELFFSIDPGYRGRSGEVSTQYSNLHPNPEEKFYIPENVYIIGTMNDIDRSVDTFDFAMRRRFRFVELKADECVEMLDALEDGKRQEAIRRMKALNAEIAKTEGLNENYQIGASYFLKLKDLDFDQLWTDYLQPLLQEYSRGLYDEAAVMEKFAEAYGASRATQGDTNGTAQN